jgi:hypothetical protein
LTDAERLRRSAVRRKRVFRTLSMVDIPRRRLLAIVVSFGACTTDLRRRAARGDRASSCRGGRNLRQYKYARFSRS